MTAAEHLIENAIFARKRKQPYEDILTEWYNEKMLELTGIKREDVIAMADHVIYSLYDGKYPEV